jgi:hypothetical protein
MWACKTLVSPGPVPWTAPLAAGSVVAVLPWGSDDVAEAEPVGPWAERAPRFLVKQLQRGTSLSDESGLSIQLATTKAVL